MNQAALGLNLSLKKTRKREFLREMERFVSWAALVTLIAPNYPKVRTGLPAVCAGDDAVHAFLAAVV